MSGYYEGFVKMSNGLTLAVNVIDSATIKLATFNDAGDMTGPVIELDKAQAQQIFAAKPIESGTAWFIDNGLTMTPRDVDRFGEVFQKALSRLEANG